MSLSIVMTVTCAVVSASPGAGSYAAGAVISVSPGAVIAVTGAVVSLSPVLLLTMYSVIL